LDLFRFVPQRSTAEHKDACDLWDLFVEKKSVMFDQDASTEEGDKKGKIILKMGKLVSSFTTLCGFINFTSSMIHEVEI